MNPGLRTTAVALLALLAARSAPAQTAQTLRADSSHSFTVHVAGPRDAAEGVVLVHDFFGVSPFFLGAVGRLAKRGYRVVGVDLYDGHRATSHAEAGALLGALDTALAARKIDAAVAALTARQRRLAVIGFSMGGRKALEAALRDSVIVATVEWYGETINDPVRLKHLAGPVLLVVGSKDGPSAAENAAAFSKAADDASAAAEIYVYPGAAHAFAQPLFNQGTTYDAVATGIAWRLTEDFLRRAFSAAERAARR
ncbi:MAG: dienelactone hydrolase family protein [Gemmatimonadaceae bacterium]